ncbi:UDP-N-acetylmuramate--L-alanine ligase [Candidatus Pacebacteria bacterium]|nr:UDP-N-acetylmuramate--L-alanine ligase [Candidatus Paceibacterota bacterium]
MKISGIKKIHFIGIGGIGMSGLARLFLHEGKAVSGSDIVETENTKKLESEGATIFYEQTADNIKSKGSNPLLLPDLVVYTEAMDAEHPELIAAREAGIRTINYFEALGEVANEYYLIAVAGTHGKTTTTAMLIDILEEASYDPTAIVGSLRTRTHSNFRAGKSKYFVVEACEYKRDFLTLRPDVLVITNLEHEHVDYYKDLPDVQNAFAEFAKRVPEEGAIIVLKTDPNVIPVLSGMQAEIIDYKTSIDLNLDLPQPGLHNQLNAAAARATAEFLGVEKKYTVEALENFAGTARRFEFKGEYNGAHVYDDYAHHPTEIRVSIAGVRQKYLDRKLTVVFQPHTFSRTEELFDDFAVALSKADRVILAPIYAAREENESGVTSQKLAGKIDGAIHIETFDEIVAEIKNSVSADDVVVIMGAGDITAVASGVVAS